MALVLAGAVTLLDARLRVNIPTAGFTYLLLVLALATRMGLREAIAAAVASMLCYNYYFLPPVGQFTIADPQNWVALAVFLITAVTASQLSDSARRRADEAGNRRQEMEQVYQFSRALMIGDDQRSVAAQIPLAVARVFRVPQVAFYDRSSDTVHRSDDLAPVIADDQLRDAARTESNWSSVAQKASILTVRFGGRTLGSLGLVGASISEAALQAIAQLGAISIERARAQDAASFAEASRQNERLKSTVLDALAHEFKTPLTSIKAAITSVLALGQRDPVQQELLTVADEEADRLTSLVTRTIEVARIEAGHVKLSRQVVPVAELVSGSIAQINLIADGREIGVQVPPELGAADADPGLASLVLRQLLDNALKYSSPHAKIVVSAERKDDSIVIHVMDDGPPIPAKELEAIFEKFYRGRDVRDRIPGTGLGLTIAREIIGAHGGSLSVTSQPGQPVDFCFSLPSAPVAEAAEAR